MLLCRTDVSLSLSLPFSKIDKCTLGRGLQIKEVFAQVCPAFDFSADSSRGAFSLHTW